MDPAQREFGEYRTCVTRSSKTTELVEQEVNGLLTFDRKPKFDSKILREINGSLH